MVMGVPFCFMLMLNFSCIRFSLDGNGKPRDRPVGVQIVHQFLICK